MQQRFRLRHAVIGYVVALVFGFNGLLTSVTDATSASGGASFALITCLGGQGPGQQWPGQVDHANTCSCNLTSCCTSGTLARNGNEIDLQYSAVSITKLQYPHTRISRDLSADHPLHLRSPPATSS
jgi:hypothetical protein